MITAEQVQSFLGSSSVQKRMKKLSVVEADGKTRLDHVIDGYLKKDKKRVKDVPYQILLSSFPSFAKVDKEEFKTILETPFYRKALNNIVKSVPEMGLHAPQNFVAPILVVWNFTNICNLKCVHCYQDAHKALPDELTLEERLRVVDDMVKNHVATLAISGGEPLMCPDFWEVAKYAHDNGLYLSVATNGTLITEEVAERLAEIVDYVEISVDSVNPEVHDAFRGGKGLWDKAVTGIKNCVATGKLDVGMAATITRRNFDELDDLINLATDLGCGSFYAFNYIPAGRGKNIEQEDLTPEMREEMLHKLHTALLDETKCSTMSTCTQYGRYCIEHAPDETLVLNHYGAFKGQQAKMLCEYIGGCGAGRLYCAFQPNGKVTPCVFINKIVGDLRENSLEEIWMNSDMMKDFRNRELLKSHCNECQNRTLCGGCRARAYGYFGDHLAPDPGCIYNQKAWDELVEEINKEQA